VVPWIERRTASFTIAWANVAAAAVLGAFVVGNARLTTASRIDHWSQQVLESTVRDDSLALRERIEHFGVHDPLLMVPDVGGAVFDNDLRILDSAGLLDEQVARNVGNYRGLQVYGFMERRPDAISTAP